jgi:hypothetical protein
MTCIYEHCAKISNYHTLNPELLDLLTFEGYVPQRSKIIFGDGPESYQKEIFHV